MVAGLKANHEQAAGGAGGAASPLRRRSTNMPVARPPLVPNVRLDSEIEWRRRIAMDEGMQKLLARGVPVDSSDYDHRTPAG